MPLVITYYSFLLLFLFFFFFNDTATTEIYTLSLHDALPISMRSPWNRAYVFVDRSNVAASLPANRSTIADRKSTRLNSSHTVISYAVFCLKKKKKKNIKQQKYTKNNKQHLNNTSNK